MTRRRRRRTWTTTVTSKNKRKESSKELEIRERTGGRTFAVCLRHTAKAVLHTAKRPRQSTAGKQRLCPEPFHGHTANTSPCASLDARQTKGRMTAHDVDVRFAVCPNSVAHGKKAFLVFFFNSSHVYGTPNQIKISCSSYISQILHRIVHTS